MRMVKANDQLTQVKKQISKTLREIEASKSFELPRSLSMDRLSQRTMEVSSESVAAAMNNSQSFNDLSHHTKHVSNPTSIFTPDPFSKLATATSASQTVNDLDDLHPSKDFSTQTVGEDKFVQCSSPKSACIQTDLISEPTNIAAQSENKMADMQNKIENLEKEITFLSTPKISVASHISKEFINAELETLISKLRRAELEIKSLNEQNRIISAKNQELIVNAINKTEVLTKERETLFGIVHDFVANSVINDNASAKLMVEQISKKLYSLIEHSNDVSQLSRINDLFSSFREGVVQIINESIHLDHRIENLASSSNTIRIESEAIISQLEEKTEALMKENQELQQRIKEISSERITETENKIDGVIAPCQECDHHVFSNDICNPADFLHQEYADCRSKDQEIIRTLMSENEGLKIQLSSFKTEAPTYPLSDLYEKISAFSKREASTGLNIKEILDWLEEKRVVKEEMEKLRSSYSNLLYKHKHLVKEYSDQKSTMDDIQKRITIKESEWQSKFKEFSTNANKLEARHSTLESILCDYAVQFQGVLSLSSDTLSVSNSDHPLPFLKYFGNLQRSNASLDHSLQHASSALSESQRVTNHTLQNLDIKNSQIISLEKEKQEIQNLISRFESEISAKEKDLSAAKSQNTHLQDRVQKLSDKLKRISEAFKWTMT